MTAPKKELERWRLDRFKTFISDFPAGEVEPTEEPDFLVRGPDRVVGLELTDLHRETTPGQIPEQASAAMRERVVRRAKEIYASRQLPPVIASFLLDCRIHIRKSDVENFANEFADLVAESIPEPNSTKKVPDGWDDMQVLPSILHSLSVHRLDAITKTFFSSPGATWVASLRREDVERALARKEGKYRAYRTKCDEVWLVINADTESMATWFEFDLEVLDDLFTTRFDRVFLVQHFGGRAHELSLQTSGA